MSEKEEKVVVAKTPYELQRMKLDKLMKNPTKPVYIAEKSKDSSMRAPLEFIRNVWGSSAGAGSGDFHVYRGVRRREYARQKFLNEKHSKEDLDEEYQARLEAHKKEAEDRTAKKRQKRLKKKSKLKAKAKKMKKSDTKADQANENDDSDDDDDSDDEVEGSHENGDNPLARNEENCEKNKNTNGSNEENFENKEDNCVIKEDNCDRKSSPDNNENGLNNG